VRKSKKRPKSVDAGKHVQPQKGSLTDCRVVHPQPAQKALVRTRIGAYAKQASRQNAGPKVTTGPVSAVTPPSPPATVASEVTLDYLSKQTRLPLIALKLITMQTHPPRQAARKGMKAAARSTALATFARLPLYNTTRTAFTTCLLRRLPRNVPRMLLAHGYSCNVRAAYDGS